MFSFVYNLLGYSQPSVATPPEGPQPQDTLPATVTHEEQDHDWEEVSPKTTAPDPAEMRVKDRAAMISRQLAPLLSQPPKSIPKKLQTEDNPLDDVTTGSNNKFSAVLGDPKLNTLLQARNPADEHGFVARPKIRSRQPRHTTKPKFSKLEFTATALDTKRPSALTIEDQDTALIITTPFVGNTATILATVTETPRADVSPEDKMTDTPSSCRHYYYPLADAQSPFEQTDMANASIDHEDEVYPDSPSQIREYFNDLHAEFDKLYDAGKPASAAMTWLDAYAIPRIALDNLSNEIYIRTHAVAITTACTKYLDDTLPRLKMDSAMLFCSQVSAHELPTIQQRFDAFIEQMRRSCHAFSDLIEKSQVFLHNDKTIQAGVRMCVRTLFHQMKTALSVAAQLHLLLNPPAPEVTRAHKPG